MAMKFYCKIMLNILTISVGMTIFTQGSLRAQEQSELQDVQQIVAIVNDQLISLYDLKQRMMLMALSGADRGDDQFFQSQAMSGLIDDKLKLQEAAKYDALLSPSELTNSFSRYAGQFNMDAATLETRLNDAGVQKESLISQLKGVLAWNNVVGGLLEPLVNITDDEVLNYIESLERDKGKYEYQVSEIFILTTDNAKREENIQTANIIYNQLNEDGVFSAIAQQFSQSSTAAVGGDMGWIMESVIPSEIRSVIPDLEINEIAEPIETEDGIYIIKLTNKRKILTLDENDIRITLKQILFDKGDGSEATLNALRKKTSAILIRTDNCELLEENAKALDAIDFGDLRTFTIREFNAELKDQFLNMEIGSGTKPLESEEEFRSYILCEKEIPEVMLPEFETVLDNLTQSRVQLIARRHLRDLRRDAIVDYR